MKVAWRDTVGKSCKNSVLNAQGANVWCNHLLMHHKVIIARICLPSVTHLFGSYIFFFTSHFIPTGPILLSLYFFNFLVSSIFFNTCLFIFLIFFFFAMHFLSLFFILSPYLLCLDSGLHIQSLSPGLSMTVSSLFSRFVFYLRGHPVS